MARQFLSVVIVALMAAPALAATPRERVQGGQQPPRPARDSRENRPDPNSWKWWMNPDHRRELGITDAQSKEIEQIFQSGFPPQRANWREAEKLEAQLSKMIKESAADVATVQQLVERVERMNAERQIMRTVMLYRMGLVLTPEQRERLEAFRKRRDESNNRRRQPEKTHQHPSPAA